jgi:hypothetical protein
MARNRHWRPGWLIGERQMLLVQNLRTTESVETSRAYERGN